MIHIGIEDLAANALIELMEHSGKREVLFKELDAYGARVVKFLNKNKEDAILVLSRERTYDFLQDYSEYFALLTNGDGICLKENIFVNELWKKFRGYLSVSVMMAFMDAESISALGL